MKNKSITAVKLGEARRLAKMTQQEVADRLEMERSSYARYETGSREPDLDTLGTLASLYGVSPDYLLGYETEDQQENFTFLFKDAFRNVIINLDNSDILDSGIDIKKLEEIINSNDDITLEDAMMIADEIGISLDELLGRRTIQEPAITKDSGLTGEFVELFRKLTPEQQSLIIAQIKGILSYQ